MVNERIKELRSPAYASLTLSFSLLGDTFLYPFFPAGFAEVGVSVTWVGVILSINRIVRILTNSFVVRLFGIAGVRTVTMSAAIVAILSTAGYSVAASPFAWIFFRVCWGLAFSVLRISSIIYALQHRRQGFALGFTKSIQEAGPMLSLLIAPILLYYFKPGFIFLLLALLSTPALYFSFKLPIVQDKIYSTPRSIFARVPSTFNLITLLTSFLIDGLIVVVLGVLFVTYSGDMTSIKAASLAAFYLGYKRICFIVLAPVGGIAADKLGINKLFNVCLALVIMGMLAIIWGWIVIGVITLFTFYTVMSALTPGNAINDRSDTVSAVSENATWRDVGAALGALVGGLLLTSGLLIGFLLIGVFILIVLFILNISTRPFGHKAFYIWR